MVQGTTDSEMMFAMFISNFERLMHLRDDNPDKDTTCELVDIPYSYVLEKQDQTHVIAAALRATLRQVSPSPPHVLISWLIRLFQVHCLALEHEYKVGIQSRPKTRQELPECMLDGASEDEPLPETVGIGRLNLAVSDGQTTCTSRYLNTY